MRMTADQLRAEIIRHIGVSRMIADSLEIGGQRAAAVHARSSIPFLEMTAACLECMPAATDGKVAECEWRPMAAAPRDGSPIIVTDGTVSDRAAWIFGVWATDLDDTQPVGWLHDEQVIGWMPLPLPEPMKP